ncbi:MAG: alpha/beta fold hydrolase, partial [Fidelibacterota bacterium]
WVLNVSTGEAHRALTADLSVWSFEFSPDSKHLLFQATETPKTDDSYMSKKLYTVSLEGGDPQLLTDRKGKLGNATWSPDGKYIAFTGGVDIHDPTSGSVFVLSTKGGDPVNITKDFKGTATWVGWKDKKTIVFAAIEGTETTLNLVSLRGGKIRKILSGGPIFYSISFSKRWKIFAFSGSTYSHPPEVYTAAATGKAIKRLTNNNPGLNEVSLSRQEVVRWKSEDGTEIEGLLLKPLGYEEGKKYPLVVQVHGGPESAYTNGWNTYYSRWTQLLASRGYAVLLPNYRGSTGRGVEFAKADQKDMGGKEFQDILTGIDYLIETGLVDPDRVGIGGGSYGGYMSAWAATAYSERFAAAVVFAGISNWISKSGTSDIPYENALVHWNMWWYENPELVWDRSPLSHIKNSRTPTLIAHGERDARVPVSQGWELYRGLKSMGVDVEFIIYPREPHGLREREHQIDFINRVLEWYDRYLKQ